MSDQPIMENGTEHEGKLAKPFISRRKVLASLGMAGMAGVVLSTEGLLGNFGFINKASAMAVNVLAVKTIADLKTISTTGLTANDQALIEGYYSAGDGGGGAFYWDSSSTQTDNGGTIIIPASYAGSGRWRRIVS